MSKHAVDELVAVRDGIEVLLDRERVLISWLLSHPNERLGAEYQATEFYGRIITTKLPPPSEKPEPQVAPSAPSPPPEPQAWVLPSAHFISTVD